jgi:hypothetical protein
MSAAALALALAAPAYAAATASWRVVYEHHYGDTHAYSSYTAIAALGSSDVWAFGGTNVMDGKAGRPVAVNWNGTSWQRSPLPSGLTSWVVAASAVSPTDIWAVTRFGGDILHWNGTQWSVAKHIPDPNGVGGPGAMSGITALSGSDVWAFGASTGEDPGLSSWHFDGTSWTKLTTSGDGGFNVTGSAVSATDIWAIADTDMAPKVVLTQYNGTSWQTVSAAPLAGLNFSGIVAQPGDDVWLSAWNNSGTPYLLHLSGGQWTQLSSPWPGISFGTDAIAPDGQGGVWVPGYGAATSGGSAHAWILHMSAGGHWSRVAFPHGDLAALALVPGGGSAVAAGSIIGTSASRAAVWAPGPLR